MDRSKLNSIGLIFFDYGHFLESREPVYPPDLGAASHHDHLDSFVCQE